MEEKKKKYIVPEGEFINFSNDDVIATSGEGMAVDTDGDWGSQDGHNW